jgi:hypothetical protein
MKKFITPQYTFTPGISGVGNVTITLEDFDIKRLVAIINVTQSTIIYIPTSLSKGLSSVVDNIVTLNFDTSSHSSSDVLQIIYEDDSAEEDLLSSLDAVVLLLSAMMEKMPRVDVNDRMAVNIETGSVTVSSLPTLATLTNLTNLNNFSGGNAAPLPYHMSNIGAAHIYNQIEFS